MSDAQEDEALMPLTQETEQALVGHRQRFLAFLAKRLGNEAAAEELLQGAFVRALERGVPAEDSQGAVNWFYAVLRNAVVDHYRRHAAESRALEEETQQALPPVITPELKSAVCECMHDLLPTLKPEYADVVQQVDLEERPVSEVAQQAGITPNNASVRLHRARAALKKQLQRSCGACAAHGCLDCSCKRAPAS